METVKVGRAERLKEITEQLEQGIQELFESDHYKLYLDVMSKFHNYSFYNTMLIAMQKPDATYIAGFSSWKNNFKRHVKKGEKGIRILAPAPYKRRYKIEKTNPETGKVVLGKDGNPLTEEVEDTVPAFKYVTVFDISQTDGKELPTIGASELTGDVEQYANFFKAVELSAPVPVSFEKIESGSRGCYHQKDRRIAINEGMSELQNLKTLIHETSYAKLHDISLNNSTEEQAGRPDRSTYMVQAESIGYTVCQHYGLDTYNYSFSYIAQWSNGRELPELKEFLKTIRDTAAQLIEDIDRNFAELTQNTELSAYKEHVKEEIAQETAAAGITVDEYAANGYEPYAAELPDPSITVSDMQEYGYTWDDMLPLKEEAVLHLYEKEDMQIFLLHADGSESIPDSTEDIKAHAEKGGIFGVHKEDWNALTEYRAMKKELAESAPEKEMHLFYGKGDAFGIYQLKDGAGMRDYHFEPYDRLQAAGLSVNATNYDLIYTAELTPGTSLEDIYTRFNIDHPQDFKGHSLSVSDIVVLHQNGENTAHYVDSFGYREVPEFLREQKQLTPDELMTGERTTPETKTIYYTINEGAARRANDANSYYDYKSGSATAEYRQMVDKAVEIGEQQKKSVDPMYHEKIDNLVDTYARKLAENMNNRFSIEARVPSILISGGSNFPVRKKEKQNAAREKNYSEWNDIQGLLEKIRSIGMGGIRSDDSQAVQKLETKLEQLQSLQDTMKAVNAYYRKHKTLDGCPNLSFENIEKLKTEMSSQWRAEDKPYPSWALSNNNAEIRRIKGRIAELIKKRETAYAGWEFDGGRVEANREDNRLQIFFEDKPDEMIRETLKRNGFRWSPKAGAWQRQLNDTAILVADRLSCISPVSGKSPVEIQKEARAAAKPEQKPSIRGMPEKRRHGR